jgi:hypothetical protein
MGGLSFVLYWLIVPARYAQNGQFFGACQIFGIRLKFTDFSQTLAVRFSAHRRPIKKCGKHTNHHQYCPMSVFILTASKLEANMEIHRYGLCIIYTWGGGGGEGGKVENHVTALISWL